MSQGLIILTAISYMVYKVCRTNGGWRQRLQQCLAPHDWHPVDADNRLTTTPNLWSFLFFGMIFLSELCALVSYTSNFHIFELIYFYI